MGIASIWTGLGLRTSGPDHRAPWRKPNFIRVRWIKWITNCLTSSFPLGAIEFNGRDAHSGWASNLTSCECVNAWMLDTYSCLSKIRSVLDFGLTPGLLLHAVLYRSVRGVKIYTDMTTRWSDLLRPWNDRNDIPTASDLPLDLRCGARIRIKTKLKPKHQIWKYIQG